MYSVVVKISDRLDGYILAGGASSRMGVNKSDLLLGGEPLLSHAVNTMSEFADTVTVVGERGKTIFPADQSVRFVSDVEILEQTVARQRAPIFGLHTALSVAITEWIAVLAVDLPFVSSEMLSRLASFRGDKLDAVVPVQPDGRLQPLCAVYRRDICLESVRMALETGELSLHKLVGGVRVRRVEPRELADLPGADSFFFNINTPDDLETAAKLAESSRVVL